MKRYILASNLVRLGYILAIVGGCGYMIASLMFGSMDGAADIFQAGDRISALNELLK